MEPLVFPEWSHDRPISQEIASLSAVEDGFTKLGDRTARLRDKVNEIIAAGVGSAPSGAALTPITLSAPMTFDPVAQGAAEGVSSGFVFTQAGAGGHVVSWASSCVGHDGTRSTLPTVAAQGATLVAATPLGGVWVVEAIYAGVGSSTTAQVTATAPTSDDSTNTYTIPSKAGVDYYVGGSLKAAGTYSVGDVATTVSVSAQAQSGYSLTGTSSWTLTFTKTPVSVTASAPTWTDNAASGGGTWTTATTTGVTYSPASGTASPGQAVTVTATAQPGYTISGTSSWTHTFPAAPTPAGPASATYVGQVASATAGSTFSFTAVPIGAADAARTVVLAVHTSAVAGRAVSSCTIGGVAATSQLVLSAAESINFVSAKVPAGTTADVALTFSGSVNVVDVHVIRAVNIGAKVTSTSLTGTSKTATLTAVPAGALALAAAYKASGVTDFTWAGLTELSDATPQGSARLSTASTVPAAAGDVAITVAGSDGLTPWLGAIAYSNA